MIVQWDRPRRRFAMLSLRAATVALTMTSTMPVARLAGQSVLQFGRPDAVLSEPFSLIKGVRELADGRVVVTDWIEQRIAVVDLAKGAITDRGRIGSGPVEFRLPDRLLAYRGDSTIMVDRGNMRLAILDRDGRIARTMQLSNPSANYPGSADAQGRLYFTIPPWNTERPLPADSVELARIQPATNNVEVIGRLKGSTMPPQNGPQLKPRMPMVVFARQDAWTVSPSGRVAIVRGGNYTVEFYDGGKVVRGPSNAYTPIRATEAERTEFARQFTMNSPMSGKGPEGSMGHTPAEFLAPARIAELVQASTFADVLPYFRPGDVRFDGSDRLWVGRSTARGEPLRYDVFNAAATRIATIQLPRDRRLLALGKQHAYLVSTSGEGLETLERYTIPPIK
jgi:sugar lactone lactonase YvrE